MDDCGVCNGGNAAKDVCGVCNGDGTSCLGCDGVPFSGKTFDVCGICDGDGSSCLGCNGLPIPAGGLLNDTCGVCGGPDIAPGSCNTTCAPSAYYDCKGVCGGDAIIDSCGVCWSAADALTLSDFHIDACGDCFGGNRAMDVCGICNGNNATRDSCGVCNGRDVARDACGICFGNNMTVDSCGLCYGDSTTCLGCDGIPGSGLTFDSCGTCGGSCEFNAPAKSPAAVVGLAVGVVAASAVAICLLLLLVFLLVVYYRARKSGSGSVSIEKYRKKKAKELAAAVVMADTETGLAPTGVVTFVFTRIAENTALWELYPDVIGVLLDAHAKIIRSLLAETESGYEVKLEADAFMLAFGNPLDALSFCVSARDKLADFNWRQFAESKGVTWPAASSINEKLEFLNLSVSMGIHGGTCHSTVDERTQRMDYYGQTVNRAARVAGYSDARGAISVSEYSLDMARAIDQDAVDALGVYRCEGEKTFKGVQEAIMIYAVIPRLVNHNVTVASTTQSSRSIPTVATIAPYLEAIVQADDESSAGVGALAQHGLDGPGSMASLLAHEASFPPQAELDEQDDILEAIAGASSGRTPSRTMSRASASRIRSARSGASAQGQRSARSFGASRGTSRAVKRASSSKKPQTPATPVTRSGSSGSLASRSGSSKAHPALRNAAAILGRHRRASMHKLMSASSPDTRMASIGEATPENHLAASLVDFDESTGTRIRTAALKSRSSSRIQSGRSSRSKRRSVGSRSSRASGGSSRKLRRSSSHRHSSRKRRSSSKLVPSHSAADATSSLSGDLTGDSGRSTSPAARAALVERLRATPSLQSVFDDSAVFNPPASASAPPTGLPGTPAPYNV